MKSARISLILLVVLAAGSTTGCAGRINDQVWRPTAEWVLATPLGRTLAESNWLFAIIESFHLVGLALLGGSVVMVDFRLLGLGLSDENVPALSRNAEPWLLTGLTISVISGVLLFTSEATKFYSKDFWDSAEAPFIYKMVFLIFAVLFTFTIRRRWLAQASDLPLAPPMRYRLVGLISMSLWLGVGVGGRLIGFY